MTLLLWRGAEDELFAQPTNLVLNQSFEQLIMCRSVSWMYGDVPPWVSPTDGSPDYYNTCQDPGQGVPQNVHGYQFPRTGNAYMGMGCYLFNGPGSNLREYLQGKLNDTLKSNKIYCVSFYVSLANLNPFATQDYNNLAITKIGAYFSLDSLYQLGWDTLPYTPQVESPSGIYLSDTLNWMEISGTFIAQGGERYITLGNFHSVTDTLRITNAFYVGNQSLVSYYFLDDISVIECGTAYSHTACGGYTWYGQTYTTSGTYTQIVPNSFGGDSTLMLNLTILNNAGTSLTQTACNSFTYDGNTFTSSGTYVQHNQNSAGCDSTFTLYLTITNDVNAVINATACNSYTLNTTTYTNSGNYTQHLTSYAGCDSVLALNLTINNDIGSTLSVSACNSYTLNSTAYNASGTYVQNFAASNGCDSILTLYLSIDSSNAAVTITDPTLTAQSIGTYQWLNCSMDFAPILNATNQSYTATANGDYAVIITNGTCLDTSACYTIYTVGFNQIGSNEELIISPNPATNQFTIENSQLKINSIHIYNVLGSVVLERIANSQKAIDISTWKAGVYFVEVETEKGIVRKKLVKE